MSSTRLHRGYQKPLPASITSATSATSRLALFSIARLLFGGLLNLPFIAASPIRSDSLATLEGPQPLPPRSPTLWIYLAVAVGLVLLGGAFAGLTIALMGQDEIYLQVIEKSGEEYQKKHAASVLRLLKRGKHWVLVTLLLGNVITNETLPIILDRSLGGGWPAVLGSTVLIVIFGEVIPQSICVRYGLPIGAWMSPLVLVLMYILAPVAWPTAKLLDRLLGEDHGTTYKKAGLKTLVTLHKTLGAAGEQLNSDEVTIISAVLDLKEKPVGSIKTPMSKVFTMSTDTVLDEKTMDVIQRAGYSRIPIHTPENPQNFVGMLLVKTLITYDPEDCKRVRDFALATLPETRAETSCLDIINFFQEGKSHMVLVSEFPGEDHGALGVVTLEDVTEELIGEEIIDESDVYIDVHRAIPRMAPAPKSRLPKGEVVDSSGQPTVDGDMKLIDVEDDQEAQQKAPRRIAGSEGDISRENGARSGLGGPLRKSFNLRRTSSITEGPLKSANTAERREPWKHQGPSRPSNLASRPRQTRYKTVMIKPGEGAKQQNPPPNQTRSPKSRPSSGPKANSDGTQGGIINFGAAGYGTINPPSETLSKPPKSPPGGQRAYPASEPPSPDRVSRTPTQRPFEPPSPNRVPRTPTQRPSSGRAGSHSTLGSLNAGGTSRPVTPRAKTGFSHVRSVRSGSITEKNVEAGGIRKTVLETSSSSSSDPGDEQGALGENNGENVWKDIEESNDENVGKATSENNGEAVGKNTKENNDENVWKDSGESKAKVVNEEGKEKIGGESSNGRKKRRRRKRTGGTDVPEAGQAAEDDDRKPLLRWRG